MADFDEYGFVPHGIESHNRLAHPFMAALQNTKAERVVEHRREGRRCDITKIVLDDFRRIGFQQMRACIEAFIRIARPQPDEDRANRIDKRRPARQNAADEIFFRFPMKNLIFNCCIP